MFDQQSIFVLRQLVLRDFRIRYRNMAFGFAWSLVNPAITVAVFTFVFTQIFPSQKIAFYPVFVLCGMLAHNFFALGWASGTTSLTGYGAMMKRVQLPRHLVPLSVVLANSLHLVLQWLVFLAFTAAMGVPVTVYWLWLPVLTTLLIFSVYGVSLLTSILDVRFRDTRYLVESVMVVIFWVTPVFYSFDLVPVHLQPWFLLHPVTAFAESLRAAILQGVNPPMAPLLSLLLVTAASLAAGTLVFSRNSGNITDYL